MTREHKPFCLRMCADLERRLQDRADAQGIPLPEFIDKALGQLLADERAVDRRGAVRRKVSMPAVVYTSGHDGRTARYRVAQMADISASGIGLRFEESTRADLKEGRNFEVMFQIAGQENPLRLACTACRKTLDDAGVFIGAAFHEAVPGLGEQLSALA